MSWRDGRDSCTCSCTLTGLPAQIPTELRRGSANKTQTVILEVPTCLSLHAFLRFSPPRHKGKRAPPPPPPHSLLYIYYYIIILFATLYIMLHVSPPIFRGFGSIYYLYIYIYIYTYYIYITIYMTIYVLLYHIHVHVHMHIRSYIYI